MILSRSRETVEGLLDDIESNRLDASPEIQRHYVWGRQPEIKGKFIESLMMGLVEAPIIIRRVRGKAPDELIDGQQRIKAVQSFMNNEFPLTGLTVKTSLKDKYYKDLPSIVRNAIKRAELNVAKISMDATDAEVQDFFIRINTGLRALSPQDIKHATFYKTYLFRKLKMLSTFPIYKNWFGFDSNYEARKDEEIILAFFAYYWTLQHSGNIYDYDKMLIAFSNQNARRFSQQDVNNLAKVFKESCEAIHRILGSRALFLPVKYKEQRGKKFDDCKIQNQKNRRNLRIFLTFGIAIAEIGGLNKIKGYEALIKSSYKKLIMSDRFMDTYLKEDNRNSLRADKLTAIEGMFFDLLKNIVP